MSSFLAIVSLRFVALPQANPSQICCAIVFSSIGLMSDTYAEAPNVVLASIPFFFFMPHQGRGYTAASHWRRKILHTRVGQLIVQGLKSTQCLDNIEISLAAQLTHCHYLTSGDDTRPICARNLRFVLLLHRQSADVVRSKMPAHITLLLSFSTQATKIANKS